MRSCEARVCGQHSRRHGALIFVDGGRYVKRSGQPRRWQPGGSAQIPSFVPPFHQDDVMADPQLWQPPRPSDGVRGRRSGDHPACGAEKSATVRDLNRFIDLFGEAEVIRGNDEVVQCESSRRARRNSKNSIPSRSRRCIICGLRTISDTIAAIFGARK
jgi:hypothetical protein